jgi:hypothetical protein
MKSTKFLKNGLPRAPQTLKELGCVLPELGMLIPVGKVPAP